MTEGLFPYMTGQKELPAPKSKVDSWPVVYLWPCQNKLLEQWNEEQMQSFRIVNELNIMSLIY